MRYNEVQCKEMALEKLAEQEKSQLKDAEILNKSISGTQKGDVYVLQAAYECILEIGKEQEILLDR